MKKGKYKRFNAYCGIAKVEHEGEEFYVVYSDYMKDSLDLGELFGKGKTKEEALENAVVNLNKLFRLSCKKIEKINKILNKQHDGIELEYLHGTLFDKEPIIPIENWRSEMDCENGTGKIVYTGEFHNADVMISEGEACLGLS